MERIKSLFLSYFSEIHILLSTVLFFIGLTSTPCITHFINLVLYRYVLFASLWWLQLPGLPCAKSGDSLSCESFHYSGSIVNYTFIVHSNQS